MGRTTKSQGLAPPAIRKDARARQARQIINKTIPAILASNPRARKGIEGSILVSEPGPIWQSPIKNDQQSIDVTDTQYVRRKGQGRRKLKHNAQDSYDDNTVYAAVEKASNSSNKQDLPQTSQPGSMKTKMKIRVVNSDTLTVANQLSTQIKSKKQPNVCILNMASPLRPGGGVLTGATSQEEFLCARTTLLPSLKEPFYRLPEIGGIFTHDVLAFRTSGPLAETEGELAHGDRFWLDVISAGMLRFPELEGEDEDTQYLNKKDRTLVEAKMRAVLRIAVQHGARKLVLGAWGCGAYGNPVPDIARAWYKVLLSDNTPTNKEEWYGVEEVVFAISNTKMARDFASALDKNLEVETIADSNVSEYEEGENNDSNDIEELQDQIQSLENQMAMARFPDLKSRLGIVLEELKDQLRKRQGQGEESDRSGDEDGQ